MYSQSRRPKISQTSLDWTETPMREVGAFEAKNKFGQLLN